MAKYFYLYQIQNNINHKIYIGVRSSSTPPQLDNYMGSGRRLKDAYKHYGKSNFTKTIIETFDSAESMYAREASIVDRKFLLRQDVYNLSPGGWGGNHISHLTPEQRHASKQRRIKSKALFDSNLTSEQRKAKYGRKHWLGRQHSEIAKNKNREAHQKYQYTILSPSGSTINACSLKQVCDEHDLNYDILRTFANKGKIPTPTNYGKKTRLNSVGWEVIRTPLCNLAES